METRLEAGLDSRRQALGALGALGVTIFLAHVLAVFVGVLSHEPWFDEAQSWLLARDASLGELLITQLRLEGHPPLWYLLLAVPAKLGFPYLTANVLSATCTALGVLLFLRVPNLPWPVRLLVPFGFFVVYQYAVIARSYALFLPLLMAVALIYPARRRRVVGFAMLLTALAFVSLHGLGLAWAFALLYVLDQRGDRPLDRQERQRHAAALGLLLTSTALLVLVLWPPPKILDATGLTPSQVAGRLVDVVHWSVLGVFGVSPSGGLAFTALAVLAWLASLAWFWRQRLGLTFLLLFGAVFAVNGLLSSRWHEGLFFHVWLFTLVLSFLRPAPTSYRAAATTLATCVLLLHAWWGVAALRYDIDEPYSAAKETAAYLRANRLDQRTVFGIGFSTLALEPYFTKPLIANYQPGSRHRFWDWSLDDPLFRPGPGPRPEELATQLRPLLDELPEIVVVGLKFRTDSYALKCLDEDPRYRRLRLFDGGLFFKDRRVEPEAFAVFSRITPE